MIFSGTDEHIEPSLVFYCRGKINCIQHGTEKVNFSSNIIYSVVDPDPNGIRIQGLLYPYSEQVRIRIHTVKLSIKGWAD